MKILFVEDDDRIARPVVEDLRHQKYIVDYVADGLTAWAYAEASEYDCILLDLMLPKLDGITLCKRIRQSGYSGFILMLTAKDTVTDRVLGLDAGADDYLVKPFAIEELSARIRALSRRPQQFQDQVLQRGQLRMNLQTREVDYAQQPLDLTPKEFMLLECLMKRPSTVFTCEMLLDQVCELDRQAGTGTIRTHLTNLRRKFKQLGCQQNPIRTIYGVGYRLSSNGYNL
ncbi:response regulator transcription factor [filamentous cyanobacterium LEGE 11480]|uniref:Response regulator transcription factor n=1 Tax=Romeriopsis navalis LEGE 11480 TaxID=2777977 RepID=A0A928VM17_9CYAN|nr:response regulator transcription factor [Romeriopsis navalis]MBE9029126.1 response regulator transcription factor [Romeriopsis navalis LEGE 11480]